MGRNLKWDLSVDGVIYEEVIRAILDSSRNRGVNVEYPRLDNYRAVASWVDDYDVMGELSRFREDDIYLLGTEGIGSIAINKAEGGEYVSMSVRASVFTIKYEVVIVTYSSGKVLNFEVYEDIVEGL